MNSNSVDVLNRLVSLHHRSLPNYLQYASPTWHRGDERAREVLQQIVISQQEIEKRLVDLIVQQDGVVDYGAFPMAFTGYHDLSFDFLLGKLLEDQRQHIATIESCISHLEGRAKAVAQEALGEAKAHLDSLEELSSTAQASS